MCESHHPRFHPSTKISTYFADLPDPRRNNGQLQHALLDIVTIALCAMLSGAETFIEMEEFGRAKQEWLRERLGLCLGNGIPSHDTFGRLFAALEPTAFARCFEQWTQALHTLTGGEVIALDGKTLRHSFDTATGKAALHLVSAWASDNRLVLAQQAVEQKSNEITAIPALLERLELQGCVVTTDALNSQKHIAEQIVTQGGDYVLALKENHALLHEDVAEFFRWAAVRPAGVAAIADDSASASEWGHGRHEVRRCWCLEANPIDWPRALRQWPRLATIVCVEAQRRIVDPAREGNALPAATLERRYYLSSLPCDAPRMMAAVRHHWGIENQVHWVLDVAFDEDQSRIRKDHAPENIATLRRLVLNLLRRDIGNKRGIKTKRHRAAWDNDYLLRILCAE